MKIVEYNPKYREAFIRFNTDWITNHFGFLEAEDIKTFEQINEELAAGGMIFFAVDGDIPLACCMAKPMDSTSWEICKMGSDKHREHAGCGSAVFGAAVNWAENHGAKRLFLISNSSLKTAIHIYEKFGFKEVKLDDYGYARGDIAFEKRL